MEPGAKPVHTAQEPTASHYRTAPVRARERQWRHFYYGQDTWRPTPTLTLSYGLRLDVINPQTFNAPGHGGFLDLDTGEIKVAGVGGIGLDGDVPNTPNWAPRAGITYRLGETTVIRAGYGRSYDIGVFGSTFGHSVTQNVPPKDRLLHAAWADTALGDDVLARAISEPPPVRRRSEGSRVRGRSSGFYW